MDRNTRNTSFVLMAISIATHFHVGNGTDTSEEDPIINSQKHNPLQLQKSSICYNIQGKASINLKCPEPLQIRTTIAFTALSQSNTCSYALWDCILQEGSTQQCDTKSACAVTALYEDTVERLLQCENTGGADHMFFQVEYYCIPENVTDKGQKIQSWTTEDYSDAVMNDTITHTITWKDNDSVLGDKTALVGILGGSVLGFVFLIALLTSFIYRIKTRAGSSDGYGPPSQMSVNTRTNTRALPDPPELSRHGRCDINFDFRRPMEKRQQQAGRGITLWDGRSTTYLEND